MANAGPGDQVLRYLGIAKGCRMEDAGCRMEDAGCRVEIGNRRAAGIRIAYSAEREGQGGRVVWCGVVWCDGMGFAEEG